MASLNLFLILAVLLVFIIFYFIITMFFVHKRFNFLQQTSIAIVIGLLAGMFTAIFSDFYSQNQSGPQSIIRNTIMLILLPFIMFEDGYNFPRRKFFQSFRFINLFGILGTLFNFFILWALLHTFNIQGMFVSVSDAQQSIILLNWETLMMASVLCSIEPVVTEKVIDKEKHPKLFSIIFGESLYKDTFAITLFEAINDYVKDNHFTTNFDIRGQQIGNLILNFFQVFAGSTAIGVAIGIILTVLMKNMRFLMKEKGISEVALTILAGFLCYVLSEWVSFSGVISMVFCGTILAHYNVYNMTEEGKNSTLIMIEVLKIFACGMIFFFIGFEMFSIQSFESVIDHASKLSYSAALLGFTFLALITARAANVFLVALIGWLFSDKKKWRLNIYELCIIYLAGLVHGAVPFALIVTIPQSTPASNCAQLNIISVVLITSLFFNMFIPKLQRFLLAKIKELARENPDHPSLKDSFFYPMPALDSSGKSSSLLKKQHGHPKEFRSWSEKYWHKFDEGVLKPFLIFNYRMRRDEIKLEKLRQREEEIQQFMQRYSYVSNLQDLQHHQNILNPDHDQNVFYEIIHSGKSSSSSQKGVLKIRLSKNVLQRKTDKILEQDYQPSEGERRRGQTEIVSFSPVRGDNRQLSTGVIEMKKEEKKGE